MNISQLSKVIVTSIIGLILAMSPVLEAKASNAEQKITGKDNIKTIHKLPAKMVNVNKANKKQLMSSLKGIGDKKAQAIIDYRNKHGAFKSTKDLLKIRGIGKKLLANNKHITLTDITAANYKANSNKMKQHTAKVKSALK